MFDFFKKLPEQIVRILIIIAIFVGSLLVIRGFVIPATLKDNDLHIKDTIKRELEKGIKYGGIALCHECHEDQHNTLKSGYHKNLSCETCHGPAENHGHGDDPSANKPHKPGKREFCLICHEYNSSRPTGFPQVNPSLHNPVKPCIGCHKSHDPVPPHIPKECGACHAEIEKTKMVSNHALLECTTCHTVPERHRVEPRSVKATKPDRRDFCGKCHDEGSSVAETPKINISTHGEKYLCWQCHYPHLPEAK